MNILPKEYIDKADAVDEILVEMHSAYEQNKVPMSEDQSAYSIKVMLSTDEDIEDTYNYLKNKHWMFAGFFKRCEIFPIKYSKRLLVWLAFMTFEFNIGGMILVAYYLQWAAYRLLKFKWALSGGTKKMEKEIDLSFVCEQCFPFGVFDKKTVHEFWDKQKVHARPDNLIDYPSACASFMPIERTEPIDSDDHDF